ncbi:MAG: heparinase II/III family protein [Planctomycetota bacterium]|jgi:hypothetical protein
MELHRIFNNELAAALEKASAEERTALLHRELDEAMDAQPPYIRDFTPSPVTDEGLWMATELAEGRIPLADGTSVECPPSFPWYGGGVESKETGVKPGICVNRIAFSGNMVRSWRKTGDMKYLQALHDLIMDYFSRYWIDSTELPEGENWLCTAVRGGDFCWDRWGGVVAGIQVRECRSLFTGDELIQLFAGLTNQFTGLIPKLSLGSNWRVHQLAGLLTSGMAYPFLRESALWRQLAVTSLNEEFEIQFRSDGSHEENCYHYGAGTWSVFTHFYAIGREAPELGIDFSREKMRKSASIYIGATTPWGGEPAWGDNYGSREAEQLKKENAPFLNDSPKRWNPMVLRAAERLKACGDFAEVDFVHGGSAPEWTSRHHPVVGYLVSRDGWENESLYSSIHMGYYDGCHTHYSLLGLEISAYGREFVVDPGVSALMGRPSNANLQRTRGHSTMTVDDLDQNSHVPAVVSRLHMGEKYDFTVGVYRGGWTVDNPYGAGCTSAGRYTQAFSGEHFRHLLFVKGGAEATDPGYWVLVDALTTHGGHEAQTRLQFLPGTLSPLAGGGYATQYAASNMALLPLNWDGWEHQIHEGETDPIEGWVAGSSLGEHPAPVYKATRPTANGTPNWHGTLLFPYREADAPEVSITAMEVGNCGFGYRVESEAWTDYIFMSNSWYPVPFTMDGVECDSACLHLRLMDGKPVRGFTCEGTYLTVDGQEVFNRPGSMLSREFSFENGALTECREQNPRVQMR